ncbi:uncharacterized protein FIBRA_02918 [Fibroporia radiculosa]|uniref:F-box domain-containing protein n=1 Tax=Fibroporia radiculosa TaxID=599839 RepID=J4HVP5_9APHY|nr:uncharacterized protein FIBRA_02918 [Fibroporia radiculosa]CCM00872.1 predicted protein [Fibroporia radiculosa]
MSQYLTPHLRHTTQLPVELWEKIIDVLADEGYSAVRLQELGLVCRAWHARCRFRANQVIRLHKMNKTLVYRLIGTLNEDHGRRRLSVVRTVDFSSGKIDTFGSFVVRMARALPRVETLRLQQCKWVPGQLHSQVFMHINAAFESVTTLDLYVVTFPSPVALGRLVRALPRLSALSFYAVKVEKRDVVPGTVQVPSTLRLETVHLFDSCDVVDFLVTATISACIKHLTFRDYDRIACPRVLTTVGASLSSLTIQPGSSLNGSNDFLDLTSATNLRALSVTANLRDLRWLASALSHVTLSKLAYIEVVSTSFRCEEKYVQGMFDGIDNDAYMRIDRALSGRQHRAFQRMEFHLRCRVESRSNVVNVVSECAWHACISSKLPTLHASGRLQ